MYFAKKPVTLEIYIIPQCWRESECDNFKCKINLLLSMHEQNEKDCLFQKWSFGINFLIIFSFQLQFENWSILKSKNFPIW